MTTLKCSVATLLLAAAASIHAQGAAQGTEVVVPFAAEKPTAAHRSTVKLTDVVVWLTPVAPETPRPADTRHPGPFRLVQKDKMFSPHLLVVPAGSSVEFPNRDPFFHNVFSLFNGKRFDLGLYESGSSRNVRFDREGVSYIFCNIHPEMGAIVLTLNTPYYVITAHDGTATLTGIPPGAYRLHIWSETAQLANPGDDARIVQVASTTQRLNPILLRATSTSAQHHLNKFGEEYRPQHTGPY